ncbi:MAG: hypothetical protein ACREGE_02570 [Candidatus Microsaccharimonas sp.]
MKAFKNFIVAGLFIFGLAAPVTALISPQTVSAGAACEGRILGVPPWYRGLTDDDCNIASPSNSDGIESFIWKIVLNIIEMAIIIVAYIAVFFILYGGFLYLTGGGNSSQLEKAKKSITNAVIGLVIAMASVGIINFIFGIIP